MSTSVDQNPSHDFRVEIVNKNRFKVYTFKGTPYRLPMKSHREELDWDKISQAETIAFARAYVKAHGIKNISQLSKGPKKFDGLYAMLYKKGWLDEVFEMTRQKTVILNGQPFILPLCGANRVAWKEITREARVDFAKAYIKHFHLRTLKELQCGPHKNPGLQTRLLLDGAVAKVFGIDNKQRLLLDGKTVIVFIKNDRKTDWQKMGERRILRYVRAYVREYRIGNSTALARGPHKNSGMHRILLQKKLMDKAFPYLKYKPEYIKGENFVLPRLSSGDVDWRTVSDKAFSDYFLAVCAENNIRTRTGLRRFGTLAQQARKRHLINTLMPDRMEKFERAGRTFSLPVKGKRIMWSTVTAQTRCDFCWAHSLEFDIARPGELAHGPHRMNGLYKAMAANHELHAAFGLPDRRYELLNSDLYCLWLQTDGHVDWARLGESVLLNYTRAYLRHNGLTQRCELEKANPSLIILLARRRLLSSLFATTREIITICGRRFVFPKKGRYIQWREIDLEILNIYAACAWRSGTLLRALPCQLKKLMNRKIVNQYRRHLPTLDNDTAERLRRQYGAPSNYALPDEILWAYGYEKYDEPRIRAKCLRKIEPPLEPL